MKTAHTVDLVEDAFDIELVRSFPRFEPADYLDSEEAIVGFVNVFLEEGDTAMLVHALETVALAPAIAGGDDSSAYPRGELFAALRAETSPRLDTVTRLMKSLGLCLVAQPISKQEEDRISGSPPDKSV